MSLRDSLVRCWYGRCLWRYPLLPLSLLFALSVALRRRLYRWGWLQVTRLPVPVIVVGNVSVGGTGKTPLAIWLVERLRAAGFRPGVVSRGYGRRGTSPAPVRGDSEPRTVGDEPVLIARRCGCPVWVGRKRAAAAQALLTYHPEVDVLVSDDGLQHYALGRDLEIVVVDGRRGFGNARLLPAGPLREPVSRLEEVDAVVVNDGSLAQRPTRTPVFVMRLEGEEFVNLGDSAKVVTAVAFRGRPVHAVAGIGNPGGFFATLARLGIEATAHAFGDHHDYRREELPPGTVLMTEKDAVKCARFGLDDAWALRVDARVDMGLESRVLAKLKGRHGQQTA